MILYILHWSIALVHFPAPQIVLSTSAPFNRCSLLVPSWFRSISLVFCPGTWDNKVRPRRKRRGKVTRVPCPGNGVVSPPLAFLSPVSLSLQSDYPIGGYLLANGWTIGNRKPLMHFRRGIESGKMTHEQRALDMWIEFAFSRPTSRNRLAFGFDDLYMIIKEVSETISIFVPVLFSYL